MSFVKYTIYLRESKYKFLEIGVIEEKRKKERGRNFTDLLNYARKRYSLFGNPDRIVLVNLHEMWLNGLCRSNEHPL
jgi:hypothetical protein